MTDPVDMRTHGGVRYNANQATAREINPKPFGRQPMPGEPTEPKKFILKFKSGETISYYEQPKRYEYFDAKGERIPENKLASLPSEVLNAEAGDKLWGGITKREIVPTVSLEIDGSLQYDDTYFDISNVMGAQFTSSRETVSHVTLNNCENTTVDLAANESTLFGDEAKVNGGKGNRIIMDKKDHMYYTDDRGGMSSRIEGPGIQVQ